MALPNVTYHIPRFLRKLWLANPSHPWRSGVPCPSRGRLYSYDIYSNELLEDAHNGHNFISPPVFQALIAEGDACEYVTQAEEMLTTLEYCVEKILNTVVAGVYSGDKHIDPSSEFIQIDRKDLWCVTKYFVFLRFRNDPKYRDLVYRLHNSPDITQYERSAGKMREVRRLMRQGRSKAIAFAFIEFFNADLSSYPERSDSSHDPFVNVIQTYCLQFSYKVNLCLGISEDDQEYVLPDCCFDTLDEAFGCGLEDVSDSDSFFPILPTMALYLIGGDVNPCASTGPRELSSRPALLQIGAKSVSDIFLRNAMVLSSISNNHPTSSPKFYSSSLSSISKSISSYDEFRCRWIPDQSLDYSRLRQRCRALFSKEMAMKMLVVKGEVSVIDLTDDAKYVGTGTVTSGGFSDVWMGQWWDPVESRDRSVAIKFLRQVMSQEVKEKIVKRLHTEVIA